VKPNSTESTAQSGETPAATYRHRLDGLQKIEAVEKRRERQLGYSKLLIALLTVIAAALLLQSPNAWPAPLICIAGFILLAIWHGRVIESLRDHGRAILFYERGLARIEDRWAETGETGERFLTPSHPYSRDLDLFGNASLFQLLCTARTRAGEETLAAWLLAAASVEEIHARQSAVSEMKEAVEFREQLFSLGDTVRLGVQPDALSAWGERALPLSAGTRLAATVLASLWIASFIAWGIWGLGILTLITTILNFAFYLRIQHSLEEAAYAVEKAAEDLQLLAGILALLERASFQSTRLQELQAILRNNGTPPSRAIRKLARIVEYLESRRNPLFRIFDTFTFWSAQLVFMAETWRQDCGPSIRRWLAAVGEFEALMALAGFAYEHPSYAMPVIAPNGPLFDAEGLAHPLLPANGAIENDVKLGAAPHIAPQLMILSGPNMAGKSTFIRSIGVNALLALCGAPVRARRLTLSPLYVTASICVLDSLAGGVSRFYAEIRRIKLISDLAHGPVPVLFLFDELLSGTNSHDRLIGTELVLRNLLEQNAIGIVSTHDLALTKIPETLGNRGINCHFQDRLGKDASGNAELIFDYKLMPGVVETSNALQLMQSIGLGGFNGPRRDEQPPQHSET
jgi:MutS domain V